MKYKWALFGIISKVNLRPVGDTHKEKELFSYSCTKVLKALPDLLSSVMDKVRETETSKVSLVEKTLKYP